MHKVRKADSNQSSLVKQIRKIPGVRELTASQITNDALVMLRAQGHRVRRVNNIPANKQRRHLIEPGWPDIQGYTLRGVIILCEVKKKGDTLKPEQTARLRDCKDCGGVAIIATQFADYTQLMDIEDCFLKGS